MNEHAMIIAIDVAVGNQPVLALEFIAEDQRAARVSQRALVVHVRPACNAEKLAGGKVGDTTRHKTVSGPENRWKPRINQPV